jgi:hypothetical protein
MHMDKQSADNANPMRGCCSRDKLGESPHLHAMLFLLIPRAYTEDMVPSLDGNV